MLRGALKLVDAALAEAPSNERRAMLRAHRTRLVIAIGANKTAMNQAFSPLGMSVKT